MAIAKEGTEWIQDAFQRVVKGKCSENFITIGFLSSKNTTPKPVLGYLSRGVIAAAVGFPQHQMQ